MRRIIGGSTAFLVLTGTLLVLPVYAAPAPAAHPVETSIDEVALGSVVDPEPAAVVTTDGDVQAGGVPESEATVLPGEGPAAEAQPSPGATPDVPSSAEPTTGPTTTAPDTTAEPSAEPTTEPAIAPTTTEPTTTEPTTTEPTTEARAEPSASDVDVVTSGEELAGVPALTVSRPDTESFSSVGVTWTLSPDVTDVMVQVRVRTEASGWGEWTTLEPDDIEQTDSAATAPADVRGGTAPYWTGPSNGVEAIVQSAEGTVPQDVRLALMDPGTSSADALPLASAAQDQAHAGTTMPNIVSRAGWGADDSIRTWDPEYAPTIKAATIHHTADGNNYTAAQVPAMMRSIYAFHTQGRGWGDIGYNVIVDKYGRIFEGRYGGLSSTVIGAHAGGFNTGTFGVSMLGNYAETDTPQAMLDSVAAVIAWKLSLYGVNPYGTTQLISGGGGTSRYAAGVVVTLPTVFAHRDVGSTTCPGQYAYDRMGQIRDMVAARIASPPGGSPIGNLEKLSVSGQTVTFTGWTIDPDFPPGSIKVDVLVDGVPAVEVTADGTRRDVGGAFPGAGDQHGFSGTLGLGRGQHTVCVVAINVAPTGANNWMGCRQLTSLAGPAPQPPPASANPVGNVETLTLSGRTLTATGWTLDPDALTSALDVHVYVNDGWGGTTVAGASRPDVAAAFAGAGAGHGFTWSYTAPGPGPYTVCVFAINKNAGTENPKIACGTVTVPGALFDPSGHADSATVAGRAVTVAGWAFDPDAPTSPATVHVYVDGRYVSAVTAGGSRPDVGAYFPGVGDDHGFSTTLQVGGGAHSVCTYAINTGPGTTNPSLGCRAVTVDPVAWNPLGNLDSLTAGSGLLRAAGWAWDPDAGTSASTVHLYVDGTWTVAVQAGQSRPDVGTVYPAAGPLHGYSVDLPVGTGQHTVCAYAINTGQGTTNPLLTCRSVTL